jgi:hypothetical protein
MIERYFAQAKHAITLRDFSTNVVVADRETDAAFEKRLHNGKVPVRLFFRKKSETRTELQVFQN